MTKLHIFIISSKDKFKYQKVLMKNKLKLQIYIKEHFLEFMNLTKVKPKESLMLAVLLMTPSLLVLIWIY